MILAVADPNGPSNAIATLVFWPVLIVVLIQVGRGLDWLVTRTIRRHADRADAIELPPHITVPRQLPERNVRDYRA